MNEKYNNGASEEGVSQEKNPQDSHRASSDQQESPPVAVGLIPAPELPEKVISQIEGELPELFKCHVDSQVDWVVETVTDPLVGAGGDVHEVIDRATAMKQRYGWHYIVCITDIPLVFERHVVVAEGSKKRGIAVISQPTLGISPLRARMREAVIHLVNELHYGSDPVERDVQQHRIDDHEDARKRHGIQMTSSRELMGSRFSELLVPIKRATYGDDELDVRFFFSARIRGYLKLLGGMVRANRPWTMLPAFRHIYAVAFATGSYGLIFTSLWLMSDHYSAPRFIIMMLAAIGSMVAWLIIDHNLWEPSSYTSSRIISRLYNAATVGTLCVGISIYFFTLFCMFFAAVLVFVPSEYMASTLQHHVGVGTTALLAWLTTSVATFAGALGASLESEEVVRNATYGYRQQLRHNKVEKLEEEQEKQKDEEEKEAQQHSGNADQTRSDKSSS